jgi:hypothetical protein
VQAVPRLGWQILGAGAACAVAGLVGYVVGKRGPGERRGYRWLRKAGFALLTFGFVVGGGMWLFGLLPFGAARRLDEKIGRAAGWLSTARTPLVIVTWLGVALVVVCLALALVHLRGAKEPGAPVPAADEEEEDFGFEEEGPEGEEAGESEEEGS